MKHIKLYENFVDVDNQKLQKLIDYCENNLDMNITLGREYFYQSITSCILDAVFSIGISYEQTKKVVERYNQNFNLKEYRDSNDYSPISEQDSILDFLKRNEKIGFEKMATEVYKNRCRTSTHAKSILKSEAAYLFAKTLNKFGINFLQDIKGQNEQLEKEIRQIPGQTTGISLDYFYMLAGDENFVKFDRMMMRFMMDAIGEIPNKYETKELINKAVEILKNKYPNLTSRLLDHQIWLFQRNR